MLLKYSNTNMLNMCTYPSAKHGFGRTLFLPQTFNLHESMAKTRQNEANEIAHLNEHEFIRLHIYNIQ